MQKLYICRIQCSHVYEYHRVGLMDLEMHEVKLSTFVALACMHGFQGPFSNHYY